MRRASPLVVVLALGLAAPASDGAAGRYPNYDAAVAALKRGDCDAVVTHLDAFLQAHPDLRARYPGFYLDVKLVMGQCSGRIRVRGVEGESPEIAPLPASPPME